MTGTESTAKGIETEILSYLAEREGDPVTVDVDEDIFATGALDSLGITDLIAMLEARHAIEVPMCDVTVENFATVARMAVYVHRQVSSG